MTVAQQLALALVKEIIADKRTRHKAPDFAMRKEIIELVDRALDNLVDEGALLLRAVSVNRNYAYEIPCQRGQK